MIVDSQTGRRGAVGPREAIRVTTASPRLCLNCARAIRDYPQASGVSLSPAGGASTQALRLRSTRSLWDPSYTDESWIGEPVRLVPRMHDWVSANYAGTKLAPDPAIRAFDASLSLSLPPNHPRRRH